MFLLDKIQKSLRLTTSVRRRLSELGLPSPLVAFRFKPSGSIKWDIRIVRHHRNIIVVTVNDPVSDHLFEVVNHRIPAAVHWLTCCPVEVRGYSLDISDGTAGSTADFCFSSPGDPSQLLPDPYFFETCGFRTARAAAESNSIEWDQRRDAIRWRGGPNGRGRIADDPAAAFDPDVLQRARLCLVGESIPGLDAKLVPHAVAGPAQDLRTSHIFGSHAAEESWLNDKYAIDIDGHSNSWSNFLVRLHFGCCVLKIDSQYGFRQWYYDKLEPWKHFIPVRADMRDLAEKIRWAKDNPDKARSIGKNGQEFARSMTFESETMFAVRMITQASPKQRKR